MIYDLKILIILSSVAFIIFLYDNFISGNKNCFKKKSFFTILQILSLQYIHHFIAIFMSLGWLFNNKYVLIFYILFIYGIFIHWIVNDGICFLTLIYNRICGYNDKKVFNEIAGIIGLKKYKIYTKYISYLLIIIYSLIALYKILFIK